ncbi:MAG: metallophosphoesterase family protein [Candidatus Bathyarchaeota archaeon]|nr:MAG: metallophosphoesterase family protein [Candidatus Bathyarchaeota archaeon]
MRIQVLSDLHTEFSPYRIKPVESSDVLLLAGDVAVAKTLSRLETYVSLIAKDVVFVAGNHDYYYGTFDEVNERLEEMDARLPNFHFLNNRAVIIGDTKFIGSTLWSDFDLASNPRRFAQLVETMVSDFFVIDKSSHSKFSPRDCIRLNQASRTYLKEEVNAAFGGKKVVITHFLPSPKSIHSRFAGDVLNPYFCCNCEDLMDGGISLWIHGHTHESIDYTHQKVQVIANPRGYFGENNKFNGKLVMKI